MSQACCNGIPRLRLACARNDRDFVSSFGLRHSFVIRHSGFVILNDHFHLNFLKCELVVNQPEQLEGSRIRHVRTTLFDSRWFANEVRMRFRHFAIE